MRSKLPRRGIFYAHVQKTGGNSLRSHLERQLGVSRPKLTSREAELQSLFVYSDPRWVLGLEPGVRLISGHFAARARDAVPFPTIGFTVLRHPVDRTVSQLKELRRRDRSYRGAQLEALYDDPWLQRHLLADHQTRVFSLSQHEALTPYDPGRGSTIVEYEVIERLRAGGTLEDLDDGQRRQFLDVFEEMPIRVFTEVTGRPIARPVEVDEQRFRAATDTLDTYGLVGVTDRIADLLGIMADRFGWHRLPPENLNRGDASGVPVALRKRILADNQPDLELYRLATRRLRRDLKRHRTHVSA